MHRSIFIILFGALSWSGAHAADSPHELTGTGQSFEQECEPGDAVRLTGSNNRLTLRGDCGAIEVNGTGNAVDAESLRAATIVGSDNQVRWSRGERPKLSQTGVNNRVSKKDAGKQD